MLRRLDNGTEHWKVFFIFRLMHTGNEWIGSRCVGSGICVFYIPNKATEIWNYKSKILWSNWPLIIISTSTIVACPIQMHFSFKQNRENREKNNSGRHSYYFVFELFIPPTLLLRAFIFLAPIPMVPFAAIYVGRDVYFFICQIRAPEYHSFENDFCIVWPQTKEFNSLHRTNGDSARCPPCSTGIKAAIGKLCRVEFGQQKYIEFLVYAFAVCCHHSQFNSATIEWQMNRIVLGVPLLRCLFCTLAEHQRPNILWRIYKFRSVANDCGQCNRPTSGAAHLCKRLNVDRIVHSKTWPQDRDKYMLALSHNSDWIFLFCSIGSHKAQRKIYYLEKNGHSVDYTLEIKSKNGVPAPLNRLKKTK